MIKMSNKFNKFNFWTGLASAIFLLLQAILTPLGLSISEEVYMSIINAVLGVFVMLGIIVKPGSAKDDENKNN